ncbi:MAG: ATP-binding cassette domain-containing protein [Lutisporaceae bacterium]
MIKQDSLILVWMEDLGFSTAARLDLRVDSGEYVVISGIYGADKINFINVLGCIGRPSNGKYIFDYNDISTIESEKLNNIRSKYIGFVFKGLNIVDGLTVYKNIEIPLLSSNSSEKDKEVTKAAEGFGLKELLHKKARELSDFERYKVALARALVVKPLLIIVDETGENLSKQESSMLLDIIDKINAEGITIITFSDTEEVIKRAARQIIFEKGIIKADNRTSQDNSKEGAV